MPPKRSTAAASLTTATDEGTRLLELSKKWRTELRASEKSDKPYIGITASVSGALEELATCQVASWDRITAAQASSARALQGASVANDLATESMKCVKEVSALETANNIATQKQVKDLQRRTKSNLTHIQRLELERSENILIAKGVPAIAQGKETQEDLQKALRQALNTIRAGDVKVEYIRRLQRVKGDRSAIPATMRIKLGSVGDKLKVFEATRKLVAQGGNIPYEFQNEIPRYALGVNKQLHRMAMEIRKMDRGIKTRIGMGKGDHWPVLLIKRRGETAYKSAPKDLMDIAKEQIKNEQKAVAMQRRADRDADLLLNVDAMDINDDNVPAAAAGRK